MNLLNKVQNIQHNTLTITLNMQQNFKGKHQIQDCDQEERRDQTKTEI